MTTVKYNEGPAGQVIVIGSQKGGVGKSTIAINVAGGLKKRFPEKTVKIIDTDRGKSTTMWHESRTRYTDYLLELGHPPLTEIMFDYFEFNKSLAQKIQSERKIIDFIIVDTGGFSVENRAFESAFLSASCVYIPYSPDRFDLISLIPILEDLRYLEQRVAEQIASAGHTHVDRDVRILMNKADRARGRESITSARELVSNLTEYCGISSIEIPLLNGFKNAISEGLTVYEVDSDSSRKARASTDLLVAEILGEIQLKEPRNA